MKINVKIKFLLALLLVLYSGFIYSSFAGNPISYLKAQSEISKYIETNYEKLLQIDRLDYNWKMNAYVAYVSHIDDSRYSSSMGYSASGEVYDYYRWDVESKMVDELNPVLRTLIMQGTNVLDGYFDLDLNLYLDDQQYTLKDKFLGDEAFDIEIYLHPYYDWTSNNFSVKEEVLYQSQDEFAQDAYDIVRVLQNTKYLVNEVKIYSYLEDGNTAYELNLNDVYAVSCLEDVQQLIVMCDYSKELPVD